MNKMNGVNLGGWLIPEKWMTPSLFEGLNAVDLKGLTDTEEGRLRLSCHVKGWITEDDFRFMSSRGINLVRLPFGFWVFEDSPVQGSDISTLDWVMDMAEKYQMKVILDMHAPELSQNGEQHSGIEGVADWFKFSRVQRDTSDILIRVAKRYANHPALYGIELLNEPKLGFNYFKLIRWYRKTAKELGLILPKEVKIIYHDAFHPIIMSGAIRGCRAVMDVHWYVIGPGFFERFLSLSGYFSLQRIVFGLVILWAKIWRVDLIVGEWSAVLAQKYFDEIDKSGHHKLLKLNIEHQKNIYRKTLGHCYWSYKVEGDGMWNWRSLNR